MPGRLQQSDVTDWLVILSWVIGHGQVGRAVSTKIHVSEGPEMGKNWCV